jgi:hypothetical protein
MTVQGVFVFQILITVILLLLLTIHLYGQSIRTIRSRCMPDLTTECFTPYLTEWKHLFEILLHANDMPTVQLRDFLQSISQGAEFEIAIVGIFAIAIVVM